MASKILIVGANFENKGAQSMLFITVDELKKRMPGLNCTPKVGQKKSNFWGVFV